MQTEAHYYCHNPHRGGIHGAELAAAWGALFNLRTAMEHGEPFTHTALDYARKIIAEVDAIKEMGLPANMAEAYLDASKGR